MDYNEVIKGFKYRHPWELSRTKCVHKSWERYYTDEAFSGNEVRFIDVGAGDCYFDKVLTQKYEYKLTAVDIAYPKDVICEENITKVTSLEAAGEGFDFGIMMDSLEYMDDDSEYIRNLASRIKDGGYIFLTLPAHRKLFADHDVLVGNKRRYDREDIKKLADEEVGISIVEANSFYWTLYLIRVLQKAFKMKADEKVTTGWNYSEKNIFTKFFTLMLNVDYGMSRLFKLKGLSWSVVLKIGRKKK